MMLGGPERTPFVLISAFVQDLAARDWRRLEAHLDTGVIYRPPDAAVVHGRHEALERWKRTFRNYPSLGIQIIRQIAEGSLVIAQQVHTLHRPDQAPVQLENIAVYDIRGGRIVEWSDHMNLDDVAAVRQSLGRQGFHVGRR